MRNSKSWHPRTTFSATRTIKSTSIHLLSTMLEDTLSKRFQVLTLPSSSKKLDPMIVYDQTTPIVKSTKYISPKRRKEISVMLKSYNSEKRLKTAPVQLRDSVEDVTLAPRRPMTSYNTIAKR